MSGLKLFSRCRSSIFQKVIKPISIKGLKNMSEWIPKEIKTHTGQKWEEDDYRLVRYINKTKYVNKHFGINMIANEEAVQCTERVVYCDGGGDPALGHPKVYINLDKPGCHTCGYCGLRFYLDKDHDDH